VIQVGAKNRANGVVSIELEVSFPYENRFVLNAKYDRPDSAYDFSVQSTNGTIEIGPKEWETSYELGCYTIKDSSEYMQKIGSDYKDYSQSSWHTFKTDQSVDLVSVEVSGKRYPFSSNTIVGLRLYKGDARKGLSTLSLVEDDVVMNIDSFRYQYNAITNFVRFTRSCDLKPNSYYSVQLLFHRSMTDEVSVEVVNRTAVEREISARPHSSYMDAQTKLGALSGVDTLAVGFTCDNRMAFNNCGTTNPSKGVTINGVRYNLSQWFSFKLGHTSKFKMRMPAVNKNYYRMVKARVYKGSIGSSCNSLDTSDLVGVFHYALGLPLEINCLDAGDYAIQFLGVDSLQELYGGTYHMGGTYFFETTVDRIANINHYSLADQKSIDEVIGTNVVRSGAAHVSQSDTFRKLWVTGTNLSKQKVMVFSHQTTPKMRVVDAVTISISIPMFFEAQWVTPSWKLVDRKEAGDSCDVYVDGGIIDNYPFHVFDSVVQNENRSETVYCNPKTLGLKLETQQRQDTTFDPFTFSINRYRDFLDAFTTIGHETVNSRMLSPQHARQTIFLNCRNFNPSVRKVRKEEKQAIMNWGAESVRRYFGIQ
jgi:hypothetical protein